MFTVLRRTHWAFLLIDVLLVAYGILVAAARSSVLQVRPVQVDERGDLRPVVVATPDVTSDYAAVLTLVARAGVKTIDRQPIE